MVKYRLMLVGILATVGCASYFAVIAGRGHMHQFGEDFKHELQDEKMRAMKPYTEAKIEKEAVS